MLSAQHRKRTLAPGSGRSCRSSPPPSLRVEQGWPAIAGRWSSFRSCESRPRPRSRSDCQPYTWSRQRSGNASRRWHTQLRHGDVAQKPPDGNRSGAESHRLRCVAVPVGVIAGPCEEEVLRPHATAVGAHAGDDGISPAAQVLHQGRLEVARTGSATTSPRLDPASSDVVRTYVPVRDLLLCPFWARPQQSFDEVGTGPSVRACELRAGISHSSTRTARLPAASSERELVIAGHARRPRSHRRCRAVRRAR